MRERKRESDTEWEKDRKKYKKRDKGEMQKNEKEIERGR